MKLLFAHGWGFDRHFWTPLLAELGGDLYQHALITAHPPSPSGEGSGVGSLPIRDASPTDPTPTPPLKGRGLMSSDHRSPYVIDDRGYFGAPETPQVEGPCLAVTHSFGTMRVMAEPPPGLVGIVAINGFERFTALPGRPGVAVRVVDRMLRRFEQDPSGVLAEFRQICGHAEPFAAIDPEPLHADLLRLRDAAPPLPRVPIVALNGDADPLLPPAMRQANFARANVRRLGQPGAGHLLPLEAPMLCALAIRGALASLAPTGEGAGA